MASLESSRTLKTRSSTWSLPSLMGSIGVGGGPHLHSHPSKLEPPTMPTTPDACESYWAFERSHFRTFDEHVEEAVAETRNHKRPGRDAVSYCFLALQPWLRLRPSRALSLKAWTHACVVHALGGTSQIGGAETCDTHQRVRGLEGKRGSSARAGKQEGKAGRRHQGARVAGATRDRGTHHPYPMPPTQLCRRVVRAVRACRCGSGSGSDALCALCGACLLCTYTKHASTPARTPGYGIAARRLSWIDFLCYNFVGKDRPSIASIHHTTPIHPKGNDRQAICAMHLTR